MLSSLSIGHELVEIFKSSMTIFSESELEKLPQHVAIIMDGNGRWAKSRGKPRLFGHRNGVKNVRSVVNTARELGVSYITLYAFSTENQNRPDEEKSGLMRLLEEFLKQLFEPPNKLKKRLPGPSQIDRLASLRTSLTPRIANKYSRNMHY